MGKSGELNRNIRVEMARANLQQKDVAAKAGITESSLSRKLTGTSDWTVSEIIAIAGALNIPLSMLLPTEKASA